MSGFENWKTPYKVKKENLVSLPLTGASCETVEIVDPWDTDVLDYRLIQTRTRRAWKGFWLFCFLFLFFFSRFQELFLLELVSCWVDLPKGSFQWKFAKNLPTTKILKKHRHLVHKCLRKLNAPDGSTHKYAQPIMNMIKICGIGT